MSMSFTDEEKRSLELDKRSTDYLGGAFVNFVCFAFFFLGVEAADTLGFRLSGTRRNSKSPRMTTTTQILTRL